MKPVEILACRASSKDPAFSFTYRTTQAALKKWTINAGDRYLVKYDNGDIIEMKASRDGSTLYTGSIGGHNQPLPALGYKVVHKVLAIAKVLKQL